MRIGGTYNIQMTIHKISSSIKHLVTNFENLNSKLFWKISQKSLHVQEDRRVFLKTMMFLIS